MHWILLANVFSTIFMTGLIWIIQVVHYPLFAKVGLDVFPAYSRAHQTLITLVVGPPMLLEAATAVLLVVWLSTAALQVPAHAKLVSGFDAATADFLVRSNWIRTIGWTARAGIALAMVEQAWRADR